MTATPRAARGAARYARRLGVVLAASVLGATLVAAPASPAALGQATASTLAPTALAATRVSGWPPSLRSVAPRARLSATVRVVSAGGVGGRLVVVQRYRPATRGWERVVQARTGAGGRAQLAWRAPSAAGSVTYRLRVTPTRRAAGATTATATVRVRPASTTTLVELVRAVNAARAQSRTCGGTSYPAVPPVSSHPALTSAAQTFARRMGVERFFAHTSPKGDDPGDRITAAGYPWRTYGEDIAAGYPTVAAVMAGWLASPGHCRIIMGEGFAEIGAGYAQVPGSPYGTYWVLDLARR